MAKKKEGNNEIDKKLSELYTVAGSNFNDKLQVMKLMVDLEKARLKADPEDFGNTIPEGLKDE